MRHDNVRVLQTVYPEVDLNGRIIMNREPALFDIVSELERKVGENRRDQILKYSNISQSMRNMLGREKYWPKPLQADLDAVQEKIEEVQEELNAVQDKIEDSVESDAVQLESDNVQSESDNVQSESETVQSESNADQSKSKDDKSESKDDKSQQNVAKSESDNVKLLASNVEHLNTKFDKLLDNFETNIKQMHDEMFKKVEMVISSLIPKQQYATAPMHNVFDNR